MKKIIVVLFFLLFIYALVKIISLPDISGENGPPIKVYQVHEKKTVSMKLEEYLVGVLAAEMPARFEKEALKAQAIAARTYALRRLKLNAKLNNRGHPQAEVCTNPAHCQGWLSDNEMKEKWGWLDYWENKRRIKSAVRETFGKVVTYQGDLIEPVYHSTCGMRTESAEEIWKHPVPYLKSVSCKWDRESPKYRSVTALSFTELKEKLGLDSKVQPVLKIMGRTGSGRVKSINIGNKVWPATEFRSSLGINSTNFSWKVKDQKIEFITSGYGHGVGMCQYVANGLAKEGKKAEYILTYYYTGVKIEKLY
jgi:stage II sporulation protein D